MMRLLLPAAILLAVASGAVLAPLPYAATRLA